MKTNQRKFRRIFSSLAATAIFAMTVSAQASIHYFTTNSDDQGNDTKMYINGTNSNVNTFFGSVGTNSTAQDIKIDTSGSVSTGNGWATVNQVGENDLTQLTFTPLAGSYEGFSFRGQLAKGSDLTVTINTITNAYTYDSASDSLFEIDKTNKTFSRIGFTLDPGEWITSVTIANADGFNSVKQVEFTPASTVPIPAAAWLLGSGIMGLVGIRRRMNN